MDIKESIYILNKKEVVDGIQFKTFPTHQCNRIWLRSTLAPDIRPHDISLHTSFSRHGELNNYTNPEDLHFA